MLRGREIERKRGDESGFARGEEIDGNVGIDKRGGK